MNFKHSYYRGFLYLLQWRTNIILYFFLFYHKLPTHLNSQIKRLHNHQLLETFHPWNFALVRITL